MRPGTVRALRGERVPEEVGLAASPPALPAPVPTSRGQSGTTDPRDASFVFLSSLLGSRVVGPGGERLGALVDLLADASEAYPRVRALRVRISLRGEIRRVDWEDVVDRKSVV